MEQVRDFFKKLVYVIIKADKSKNHRARQRPGNSVRVDVAILSLKSAGQASMLQTQAGFLYFSLETE